MIRPIALLLSIIALACAGPAKEQEPPPMEPEKPLDVQPPALLERSVSEVEVNEDVELWGRFDEALMPGASIVNMTTAGQTIAVSTELEDNDTLLRIVPQAPLAVDALHAIALTVSDLAGNSTRVDDWSFSTGGEWRDEVVIDQPECTVTDFPAARWTQDALWVHFGYQDRGPCIARVPLEGTVQTWVLEGPPGADSFDPSSSQFWSVDDRPVFAWPTDVGTWVASYDGAAWSTTLLDDAYPRVLTADMQVGASGLGAVAMLRADDVLEVRVLEGGVWAAPVELGTVQDAARGELDVVVDDSGRLGVLWTLKGVESGMAPPYRSEIVMSWRASDGQWSSPAVVHAEPHYIDRLDARIEPSGRLALLWKRINEPELNTSPVLGASEEVWFGAVDPGNGSLSPVRLDNDMANSFGATARTPLGLHVFDRGLIAGWAERDRRAGLPNANVRFRAIREDELGEVVQINNEARVLEHNVVLAVDRLGRVSVAWGLTSGCVSRYVDDEWQDVCGIDRSSRSDSALIASPRGRLAYAGRGFFNQTLIRRFF